MPLQTLLQQIATATTAISLITTSLAALTWGLAQLIRTSGVPWREYRIFGETLAQDAIKSLLYLSLFSAISALVTYVVSVIASAA